MSWSVTNLLYEQPELYEAVYPEPDEQTPSMCLRMFEKFLRRNPQSILDVGCGIGRDLNTLSRTCADCVGIDYLPQMVEYAGSKYRHLNFLVGDMRRFRLGRTFDVVMCMGSTLMYALNNSDIESTLQTFVTHSHEETLLILDLNNSSCFLNGEFKQIMHGEINTDNFNAKYTTYYSIDRKQQIIIRKRIWEIPEETLAEDYCEYRMFFPQELVHLLEEKGYVVVGMFDNMVLEESDLSGPRLYVAAKYEGQG